MDYPHPYIQLKDGKLDLNQTQLVNHWTDDRAAITLKDMLQMQSGGAFDENYITKTSKHTISCLWNA